MSIDEFATDKSTFRCDDFVMWQENGILELTPKFQRRPVWELAARSYFIDTILRGMTVPPIYLRLTQDKNRTKTIREVVDGQQRIRSVLDFMANKYRLSSTLTATWKGKKFSQLTADEQKQIKDFGFTTETFKGISDKNIYEVFSRLNTNGVRLNAQELRNGKYFGHFKTASLALALDHLEFWRINKIFSDQQIARMLEVELTSELLIAGREGMQDKKKSLDTFYGQLEEVYPERARDERRFRDSIATISECFLGALDESQFHKRPLFYTLYCVVFHYMFGIPGVAMSSPRKRLGHAQRDNLKDAVAELSTVLMRAQEDASAVPKKYADFIAACLSQTDNIRPRKARFETLYSRAFD